MLYLTYKNVKFKSQIEYIFQVLLRKYGVKGKSMSYAAFSGYDVRPNDVVISYGKAKPPHLASNHIHIYESDLFGECYLSNRSMPKIPLGRYENIPVLYEGDGEIRDYVIKNQTNPASRSIDTKIDIFASSFFMLSRYEEIISARRDQYNRFPAEESIAYKENFLDRPIVNVYLELLWSWIDSFGLDIEKLPLWPVGKDFAVCLTHDVDHVRKSEGHKRSARLLLRQKPLHAAKSWISYIGSMLSGKNPYWNFQKIVEKEKEYGFNSSFYFLAGHHHPLDASYKSNDKEVKALIRSLNNEGVEIGLHGSFNSYNDDVMLCTELAALNSIVQGIWGIRQHYLRFDPRLTCAIQDRVGLRYDTTMCFAENHGYRSGFDLPYHPYDFETNKPLRLLEIPLIVMDSTLFDSRYQSLTPEAAWRAVERILETTKCFKSCTTLLWHNTYFDDATAPGFGDIYWRALDWIRDNNGWGASGREIYEWWTRG